MFLTKIFSNLIKRINKYDKIPKTYIPFVQFPLSKLNGSQLFRGTGQRVLRYFQLHNL